MTFEILKDAVARNQVILVAGTGVSAALGGGAPTSTWLGLIEDGLRRIEELDADRGALLRMRLEAFQNAPAARRRVSDLINLGTELRQEFDLEDRQRFGRWLETALGKLKPRDTEVARAIAELGTPILTTNYDTLLEQSLSRGSASWEQPDLMRRIATRASTDIGHLHGIYNAPDTVILSDGDYRRVLADRAAQTVQTSAFTLNTFLFVGFGSGTDDPNFKLMIDNFGASFQGTAGAHYRLCLEEDVRPGSDLDPVVDLPYGVRFSELSSFLRKLAPDASSRVAVDKRARSFDDIESRLRENSTLWRDAEQLDEKTINELVVPPIFLPEPHDQYATSAVLESEQKLVEPIDTDEFLKSSRVILIAGEENAGVSTAVLWTLNKLIADDPSLHSQYLEDPLVTGPHPVHSRLKRLYRTWGLNVDPRSDLADSVVGVDNLRFESSERFSRAVADLGSTSARALIIGVRQQDALDVLNALNEQGLSDVAIGYLGRFSENEAQELARRISPGGESRLVHAVMIVIREKRLPRNPFTITLLIELIRNGSHLKERESEIAVLDRYLDLLLAGEFFRGPMLDELTLRNKRVVLVTLARRLVEAKEDKAQQADVIGWIEELFHDLGWPYDAMAVVNDLVRRRVLSKGASNTLRFQRSSYLELMAGIAAQEDGAFRGLVFSAPLELASIIRTYAAMTRNDGSVLGLMEEQLDALSPVAPVGSIFANVRQIKAPETLFSDDGRATTEGDAKTADSDRAATGASYYDYEDDSDSPAFLTARIEDLPAGRVAMLVVDLASRVLRDTDELRDQEHKARVLKKVLNAWVYFVDLTEGELRQLPDLDEVIENLFNDDGNMSETKLAEMKAMVLKVAPSFLAFSGISYCLAGPSIVPLLQTLQLKAEEDLEHAALIRTLVLYASGSRGWVESLGALNESVLKSWFSSTFLASLARYAYIVDGQLSDGQRESIRAFLRASVAARYSFLDLDAKNRAMNRFEAELRRIQLKESRRPKRAITVLE